MTNRTVDTCRVTTECCHSEKVEALRRDLPKADELRCSADRYKVLGHPVRLAILHLLACEECCVCDLAQILDVPTSTLSQHLTKLRQVGLLRSRQDGKFVFYSLAEPLTELLSTGLAAWSEVA